MHIANKSLITEVMQSEAGLKYRKSRILPRYLQSTSSLTLLSLKRDLLSASLDSERQSSLSRFVCHPESHFRVFWDFIVTLLATYQAVVAPYLLCFEVELGTGLLAMEAVSVSVFLLDIGKCYIGVSCNTGFYWKGELVLDHKKIVAHYAKLGMWLDILASVPLNWLHGDISHSAEANNSSDVSFSDIVRIAVLFRFYRLRRLKEFLVKIEDFAGSARLANALVFVRLLLVLFFSAHWMACWFYYVSNRDVDYIHNLSECSLKHSEKCGNAELYVTALYWVFSTMTTVGYGDITPLSTLQRFYGTFIMVGSVGLFAYLLGNIGSLVAKNNAEYAAYRERVVLLNIFMAKNALPRDLQYRSRRFLEYIWAQQRSADMKESDILSTLSEPLKDEIYMEVNGAVLMTCAIFRDYPEILVGKIGMALSQEAFAPGDEIFQEGQIGTKMYFLREGKVDIFHSATGTSFSILKRKSYFGEISFYSSLHRCASARCWEFAELLTLDRVNFNTILNKYPTTLAVVSSVMEQVRKGDLALLHIRCYLCKETGHVARKCSRAVIKGNTKELQENWLHKRSTRTRYISHASASIMPNYRRAPKRQLQMRHSAKNVLGVRRASASLKQHSHRLYSLAQSYQRSSQLPKQKTPTTHFSSSSRVPSPELRHPPLAFNSILFESSSFEEESAPSTPLQDPTHSFVAPRVHVALPDRETSEESSRLMQTFRRGTGDVSEWTNT